MTGLVIKDISSLRVRSNQNYCFKSFANLQDCEQDILRSLSASGDYAGILVSEQCDGLTAKAVSLNTFELFRSLSRPRRISELLESLEENIRNELLAALVLDGVLEVLDGKKRIDRGCLYDLIVADDSNLIGEDTLSRLSFDAIRHCYTLSISNPIDMAWKLYFYNRMPATPKCVSQLPHAESVLRLLNEASGDLYSRISAKYQCLSRQAKHLGWILWVSRQKPQQESTDELFKLYISPSPENIGHAFCKAAQLLLEYDATAFKIGPNAYGLLRPDKFVIYFDRLEVLREFAERISARVGDLRVHGVPFAAQLDSSGLISWGVDPRRTGHLSWHSDDSWRIWVCNRLASALDEAKRSGMPCNLAERYSLVKLWLLGVDTRTWIKRSLPGPMRIHQTVQGTP